MKTKTEARHTPTLECPGTNGGEYVLCYRDKHGKRRTVTHVGDEKWKDIIIHAVNSHEALLEAANRAMAFLLNGSPADGDPTVGMRVDESILYQALKEAIAKAEGEARP